MAVQEPRLRAAERVSWLGRCAPFPMILCSCDWHCVWWSSLSASLEKSLAVRSLITRHTLSQTFIMMRTKELTTTPGGVMPGLCCSHRAVISTPALVWNKAIYRFGGLSRPYLNCNANDMWTHVTIVCRLREATTEGKRDKKKKGEQVRGSDLTCTA